MSIRVKNHAKPNHAKQKHATQEHPEQKHSKAAAYERRITQGETREAGICGFLEARGYLTDRKVVGNIYHIMLSEKPSPVVLRHFGDTSLLAIDTSALICSDVCPTLKISLCYPRSPLQWCHGLLTE